MGLSSRPKGEILLLVYTPSRRSFEMTRWRQYGMNSTKH
jgi:hypothetical protein